ncbi:MULTISPECIES: hypothetical protein [unclassified Streptomyces]|uniref:hypothetical protein n=1 Tax=unclassified Streptomyces TaxID=2593676 RepID=UPI002E0EDBB2|nr:hypothetical protein OG452_16315 [Streptomyces sp. NBC_01197]WSS50568.1 hypothetical protein OG708_19205 [Streptomyces sp. NBC_01180]
MTLVQMQPRPAKAIHSAPAGAMDTAGPQVCDDMTIEVALSLMASAHTRHLLICDNDRLFTGSVPQAQLAAVRDSSTYTDRVQLRDMLDDRVPFASPVKAIAEAKHTVRGRRPDALRVVDEHGSALGVLALPR